MFGPYTQGFTGGIHENCFVYKNLKCTEPWHAAFTHGDGIYKGNMVIDLTDTSQTTDYLASMNCVIAPRVSE